MRKLLFGVTALAVATALVASAIAARPYQSKTNFADVLTSNPNGGNTQTLNRSAGFGIESTEFEAADGWIAGAEFCGGAANGFCTCATCNQGCFPDLCPAAGTNCCLDDPHPVNQWYRSGTDQHCTQPHISTANPACGTQHLRFAEAPTYGCNAGTPGCVGFNAGTGGISCRQTAFTPNPLPGDQITGTAVIDFDIAGSGAGGAQFIYFCTDNEAAGPNAFIGFYFTGQITVYNYSNATYYYHPWDTTGAYGHVNILFDVCGNRVEHRYNGTLIVSQPWGPAIFSPEVDRCIMQEDNGLGTWDIDCYTITRTACPAVCGNGVIEPGEACDGAANGTCPPGRCNATCTGCTPICTLAAPCELVNGQNGPFVTPCDPSFGCIVHYTADTEVVSIDTCGSNFDTYILYWGSTADPGDPGDSNDDCCDPADPNCGGSFGAGSDPSAACYNDVFPSQGGFYESCTCHDNPLAGDNDWTGQIAASGPALPPSGRNLMVFIDKKQTCGVEWLNGACCDTNGVTGGDPAGCTDDVAQADCSGPEDTWYENKFCSTVTCDCVPDCTGAECGDDGCGGSCGTCDDSSACTTDACVGRTCEYTPISCDDSNACTTDTCNPATGCVNTPLSCDDGLFCNGAEGCSPSSGCTPGTPPCDTATEICNEDTDTCDLGVIPTVSEWGLVLMALLLLAGAKVYFGRRSAIA